MSPNPLAEVNSRRPLSAESYSLCVTSSINSEHLYPDRVLFEPARRVLVHDRMDAKKKLGAGVRPSQGGGGIFKSAAVAILRVERRLMTTGEITKYKHSFLATTPSPCRLLLRRTKCPVPFADLRWRRRSSIAREERRRQPWHLHCTRTSSASWTPLSSLGGNPRPPYN